jgi:DNA helicase II / ATP-dependent DNA helicase PcrA
MGCQENLLGVDLKMSDTQKQEWTAEQDNINKLKKIVDIKTLQLLEKGDKVTSDVMEIKKTFWNDVTVNIDEPDDILETYYSIQQQVQLLSERERTHNQIDKQVKILSRLKSSPYFGRIDFLETGETQAEIIYIGISSLMDIKEENFLIYDWRAPIASMYYDYSPGPASYKTPSGIYGGEIKKKRQFIIRNTELIAMFDTGVTIGDEMLQEVLANQADPQMKNIVATIQKEQNQIIRNERAKLLVVQGVAGSGKTSAALQRVAYLLYRYRGTLNSENIMLFSPNTLFNSYVATVLPELGEENMKQATFQEYLSERIHRDLFLEDAYDQMEYLLTAKKDDIYNWRMESIRYKSSNQFKRRIDEYEVELKSDGIIFEDVIFQKRVIISKKDIHQYFYQMDHNISIPNRIEMVRDWLRKELKRVMKLELKKEWVEEEVQLLNKKDYLDVYNKLQEKERFSETSFDDFEREEELLAQLVVNKRFKPLFNWIKKLRFVNLLEVYRNLFKVKHDTLNWEEVNRLSLQSLNELKMTYEDATPFVYLQDLILGRRSETSIRHVFIDEAQDYSPFQFSYIQKLFPNSKMTLLGDINQAIYSGVTKSETVLADTIPKVNDVETITLTKTYRSTKQIVEFTRAFIENGHLIEPFNRQGHKPTLKIVNNHWDVENNVISRVKQQVESGYKTVAIICKTAKESKIAFDLLKNEIPVRLIEKGTIAYEQGTLIIPAYLAKGIEFDSVIIYDASQYNSAEDRKLFYTACTRAMHELHVMAIQTSGSLIEQIPADMYEKL